MPEIHLTVAAVVQRQSHYLMVEEIINDAHKFNQPAGHVEPGETLVEAVVRETREETAWEFKPVAIIGAYLWTKPSSEERFLRVAFTGRLSDHHTDESLDPDILRAVWLTSEDIQRRSEYLRSPMVTRCIEDFETGRHYPLSIFSHADLEDIKTQASVV